MPRACKIFFASTAKRDFRAGRDENEVGRSAVGFREHVGALRNLGVAGAEERQFLTREHQHPRRLLARNRELPGFQYLERIGRTHDVAVRRRAQRRELFDRLMRRAVFTEEDRVVREDEDAVQLRQTRQANAGLQ